MSARSIILLIVIVATMVFSGCGGASIRSEMEVKRDIAMDLRSIAAEENLINWSFKHKNIPYKRGLYVDKMVAVANPSLGEDSYEKFYTVIITVGKNNEEIFALYNNKTKTVKPVKVQTYREIMGIIIITDLSLEDCKKLFKLAPYKDEKGSYHLWKISLYKEKPGLTRVIDVPGTVPRLVGGNSKKIELKNGIIFIKGMNGVNKHIRLYIDRSIDRNTTNPNFAEDFLNATDSFKESGTTQ